MSKKALVEGRSAFEVDQRNVEIPFTEKYPIPKHHRDTYPKRGCITHNFRDFRCTECGGIQASYKPVAEYYDRPSEDKYMVIRADLAWCLGKLRGLGYPAEHIEKNYNLSEAKL